MSLTRISCFDGIVALFNATAERLLFCDYLKWLGVSCDRCVLIEGEEKFEALEREEEGRSELIRAVRTLFHLMLVEGSISFKEVRDVAE